MSDLALSYLSVCLFISMEELGYNWMDFCEVLYWGVLAKCQKSSSFVKIVHK